ncbi:MAG: AAC(3) family N-acetyltransferase [Microlunatus sp.]|nr:AAC(3) family N-acetyltransferase [Microlunatus sp.]
MAESLTADDLIAAFGDLGVRPGEQVLLHSSLSSLGHVNGGADTVIDALLEVLGPDGTLLVPTLTGHEGVGPDADVLFDVASTPAWTGTIPETLRGRPEAVRSLHPTHSVAAVGADAQSLTDGHEDTLSPCGIGSPYVGLADRSSARILLLGVGHESNTTLHAVEELAAVPYHLQSRPARGVIRTGDTELVRTFWPHRYGTPRRFPVIEQLLVERGAQRTGTVGPSPARLVDAAALLTLGRELLAIDPEFLVEAPPE